MIRSRFRSSGSPGAASSILMQADARVGIRRGGWRASVSLGGFKTCGTCHEYGKTGPDTLVTPFAWAMRARGLTGDRDLLTALDRVAADAVDSDGDGTTDVAELTAGTDPNSPSSAPGNKSDPQLGCSVAAASATDLLSVLGVAVAGGLLGLVRRRRRFTT